MAPLKKSHHRRADTPPNRAEIPKAEPAPKRKEGEAALHMPSSFWQLAAR